MTMVSTLHTESCVRVLGFDAFTPVLAEKHVGTQWALWRGGILLGLRSARSRSHLGSRLLWHGLGTSLSRAQENTKVNADKQTRARIVSIWHVGGGRLEWLRFSRVPLTSTGPPCLCLPFPSCAAGKRARPPHPWVRYA